MSAEPQPTTISTDDAVEAIWERVLDGTYSDVAAAARDMWRTFVFSPDDRDFLCLFGLTELTIREQNHMRRSAVDRPSVGWGSPHPKAWDKYAALTFPARAADGKQKPLLLFTRDDLAAFGVHWGVQEQAARRRRDWGAETDALLVEHGVEKVADLPALVLRKVNESAREAMGRQS